MWTGMGFWEMQEAGFVGHPYVPIRKVLNRRSDQAENVLLLKYLGFMPILYIRF
jgi:hypothetical protein